MMACFGPYQIDSAGASDIGRRRKSNDDALLLLNRQGVFCIADGVGGSERGDLASQAVVRELLMSFDSPSAFCGSAREPDPEELSRKALNRASAWIHERAGLPETAGMATTVVTLIFRSDPSGNAIVLHAGDSRCYRHREGALEQLTRDHSGAELVGVGDENLIPEHFRHLITRAVGTHPCVDLDRTAIDVRPNDLFLLCSDGLNRMLSDQQIAALLTAYATASLKNLANRLIEEANRAGGADNITVILVRVHDHTAARSHP